jgi:dephospho-CoA kinase
MLIGLTGTYASGKGTIAKYLQKKGFAYFSLSDELRHIMEKEGIATTRENLIAAGKSIREKKGKGYLAELVLKKAGEKAVVDSIRNEGEVRALRKREDFTLVAVDAPIKIRFQRAKKRSRVGDPETFVDFRLKEQKEMSSAGAGQQIGKCMGLAEYKIINDSSKEKLYKKVEEMLQKIMQNAAE